MTIQSEMEKWVSLGGDQTITLIRKRYGMKPLSERDVPCLRCKNEMKSQFNGESRIEFYCEACRVKMRLADKNYGDWEPL